MVIARVLPTDPAVRHAMRVEREDQRIRAAQRSLFNGQMHLFEQDLFSRLRCGTGPFLPSAASLDATIYHFSEFLVILEAKRTARADALQNPRVSAFRVTEYNDGP
jgi:hypothetical protein